MAKSCLSSNFGLSRIGYRRRPFFVDEHLAIAGNMDCRPHSKWRGISIERRTKLDDYMVGVGLDFPSLQKIIIF